MVGARTVGRPGAHFASLKTDRAYRADPAADLGWIGFVHVEKMRHGRLLRRHARIIERHCHGAVKNLERWAVPVFDHLMIGGESRVYEGTQVLTDRLAPVPIGNAEIAHGILRETIEAFAKSLVVNFLPHRQ